jgi:hypothetical protein
MIERRLPVIASALLCNQILRGVVLGPRAQRYSTCLKLGQSADAAIAGETAFIRVADGGLLEGDQRSAASLLDVEWRRSCIAIMA